MAPRTTALTQHPTQNAPKGPAIPLAGPLLSLEMSSFETSGPTATGVHPEFSPL
jgi:hypothetical protein